MVGITSSIATEEIILKHDESGAASPACPSACAYFATAGSPMSWQPDVQVVAVDNSGAGNRAAPSVAAGTSNDASTTDYSTRIRNKRIRRH